MGTQSATTRQQLRSVDLRELTPGTMVTLETVGGETYWVVLAGVGGSGVRGTMRGLSVTTTAHTSNRALQLSPDRVVGEAIIEVGKAWHLNPSAGHEYQTGKIKSIAIASD